MHVAAQSDQVTSLYYFKTKGMDVNAIDQQLNTPLHWAMIEQSEIACSYLLAWKPNINKQDSNG